MTTPNFSASAVVLWALVGLAAAGVAYLGLTGGVHTGRWWFSRRQLTRRHGRPPAARYRRGSGPPCPECGTTSVPLDHGHASPANVVRASLGRLVLVRGLPCPPPWVCPACHCRFAPPAAAVTPLPPRRLSGPLRPAPRRAGGLAPIVPLLGALARREERRRQRG